MQVRGPVIKMSINHFHGDNGGSNPPGDANQIQELPVSGSSFSFDCDKNVIISP